MIDLPELLIGLDDTDTAQTAGTGRLARELARRLHEAGTVRPIGVTRHQHLVDPRIPYTSHNSSACIALADVAVDPSFLVRQLTRWLVEGFHPGSDPGLCVARAEQITPEAIEFGRATQQRVVTKADAQRIARGMDVHLSEHGGMGTGIIGSLAAVALRWWGTDGRFVDLPGIRELTGRCRARDVLARTPIVSVRDPDGRPVDDDAWIDTQDWIRPDLVDHQPVLHVQRASGGGWITRRAKKTPHAQS